MFRISILQAAAGAVLLSAATGAATYFMGRSHQSAQWQLEQADSTQTQNQRANEASDEVRELDDCDLRNELNRLSDGCP